MGTKWAGVGTGIGWGSRALALALSAAVLGVLVGAEVWLSLIFFATVWTGLLIARRRRLAEGWSLLALLATVVGYFSLQPSNDRDWAPEFAHLPQISVSGERLEISNIRDFKWQATDLFEERWRDEAFDLSALESLELLVEPFGPENTLAHTMLRFGFADGRRLVVSIEARRERGEVYGLLAGATRQFELVYLFATEGDAVDLRTGARGSEVFAYPVRSDMSFRRSLLLDLCQAADALRSQPQFYALVRRNCTTMLLRHVDGQREEKIGWRLETLLPARAGALIHRLGLMDTDLTFEQAQVRFRIEGGAN